MNPAHLNKVIEHFLREDAADADLLRRFVQERDAVAFAEIVRRHGPLVWAVCRRGLQHLQDAEDAFQATFLLLVRRPQAIRSPERLASWLHGTAYRMALQARKARRKRQEKEAGAVPRTQTPSEGRADLREVLDRELVGLPEKYRTPVVLCDLEGMARREVARQLGLAEGTVASRLSRGRAMLAKRLGRYGLPSGAVAALASEGSAAPPELLESTVKAAGLLAAGSAVFGGAVVLVEGVFNAMLLTKFKIAAAILLVVAVAGIGAGRLLDRSRAADAQAQEQPKPRTGEAGTGKVPRPAERVTDDAKPPARSRAEAAQRAFELRWMRYRQGLPDSPESLYAWSRRWVEAQRDLCEKKEDRVAAYEAHLARMKELAKMVKQIAKVEAGLAPDVAGTEFYVAEAELWLAQAKGK